MKTFFVSQFILLKLGIYEHIFMTFINNSLYMHAKSNEHCITISYRWYSKDGANSRLLNGKIFCFQKYFHQTQPYRAFLLSLQKSWPLAKIWSVYNRLILLYQLILIDNKLLDFLLVIYFEIINCENFDLCFFSAPLCVVWPPWQPAPRPIVFSFVRENYLTSSNSFQALY